jgi:hypothetical protein
VTAGDQFGCSVALSGDGNTALIGALQGNSGNGVAYIFTKSGTSWSQAAALTVIGGVISDQFGCSVALSGDGNTALIGGYGRDTSGVGNSGAAYIFTKSGTWVSTNAPTATLTLSPPVAGDFFGNSVALDYYGNTALIGAIYRDINGTTNSGAAYIFTKSGTWASTNAPIATLTLSSPGDSDNFGNSVALSSDGNTALVGAPNRPTSGVYQSGAAYIFTKSGTWASTGIPTATLTLSSPVANDYFGYSATLSGDGNTALIGAYGKNTQTGAAYIFTKSGTWASTNAPTATFTLSSPVANDNFGYNVALNSTGDTALIGAYGRDIGGLNSSGAAYIFTKNGTWTSTSTPTATLTKSTPLASDEFGYSVALNSAGDTALIGARSANTAYIYT